ncbi:MAG TPA: hypothetical protein VGJ94_15120 [Syntrophorhabdaceae bacterium]|jgi:hypothetical protein
MGGKQDRQKQVKTLWKRHSLTIMAGAILALWVILYVYSDPKSHPGSFYGNAIADWVGLLISVFATKWFYEKGSRESRQPRRLPKKQAAKFLYEHSLTIVLVLTGIGWLALYLKVNPESKWGTVISNLVSEWTQQIGLVIMTKKLVEIGSKEDENK